MKIYIAGKITGNPNFKEEFLKAQKRFKKNGFTVMIPPFDNEGFEHQEYMHVCYAMIDVCDNIYLLKNWTDSKGAKLEFEYAKVKNKRIFYE